MALPSVAQHQGSPIRVLHIVDSLGVGGLREMLLDQLSGLSDGRLQLGLLTLEGDLENARQLLPAHVAPLAASYRRPYGYGVRDYLSDGLLMRAVRQHGDEVLREIGRFAPTILHFHTNPRDLGLGILAQRSRPMQLVFTDWSVRIRQDDYSALNRFLLRLSYRRLYRRYHVVSVGPVVGRCNSDGRFLDPAKHHLLLENSVDLQTFVPAPVGVRPRPLQIIYVGRVDPGKGVDTLIRAFATLDPVEPAELVIVGPDAMGGAMQDLAARIVQEPMSVRFLGAMPRAAVPGLLHAAAIGVLPSRREGLPLAVLEQMASELPVIVSNIPELTDIVSHRETGLVVPLDDVQALAAALEALLHDQALRTRLGRAARRSVEDRQAPNPGSELMRLYENLAALG